MRSIFSFMTVLSIVGALHAAPVVTTTQGQTDADLGAQISSTDLIQGLIATELPGDMGWHPANSPPQPGQGLDAFTDGNESTGNVTGLLNDFPGAGNPAKLIDYAFASPVNIGELRVFTGNNGKDGRVFHTYTVEFSSDNGLTYTAPIYVQSHPSGTINNSSQPNPLRIVLTQLTDSAGPLAKSVTNMTLKFYSVDNTGGQMRDPYDGVNPFTGTDDTLTAAFVSPLVWEIDVMPAEICNNGIDDDGDGLVDCADAQCASDTACACNTPFADADADQDVDMDDFGVWQLCFTGSSVGLPAIGVYDCACFDKNTDDKIDQFDFVEFTRCATRASVAWDPLLTPNCNP